MVQMIGDSRACAMAVAAETTAPAAKEPAKIHEREAGRTRAFLFGHYDSRGGAMLVEARNLLEAFPRYAEPFGWETVDGRLESPQMKEYIEKDGGDYEEWRSEAIHGLMQEDFMYGCTAIFLDEMPDGEQDLDKGYAEDGGYSYGRLEYRWNTGKKLTKWEDAGLGEKKTLVFWKGKKPVVDPKALGMDYLTDLEVRIARESLGEDAFGVVWMPG